MSRRALSGVGVATLALTCLTVTGQPSGAAPDPTVRAGAVAGGSLGLGLEALVSQETSSRPQARARGLLDPTRLAVRDDAGRVLVTATPRAGVDHAAYRRLAERSGLEVQADEPTLGTLEGFVRPDDVAALQGLGETGTLSLSPAPVTSQGEATSQGVAFQRVDRVQRRGTDGSGITIGALSDSYDTAQVTTQGEPLTVRAADDVASGDLPGPYNPRNRRPVVVLDDYAEADATDEGRAMLQIAHDVAPGARLCFATAFTGFLEFAENVRRLADPRQGCGADVVVDDITYFVEPYYSDSALTDAIDDVAADGVHYFSSAGNSGDATTWEGRTRFVGPQVARRSGLSLADVPPELYAGGLVDLDQGGGSDAAMDVVVGADGTPLTLKWDDPVDLDGPLLEDPWFTAAGEVSAAEPAATYTVSVPEERVGQQTLVRVDGVPSGSTDVVITLTLPDGTVIGPVDTATSPEVIALELPQAGDYELLVEPFDSVGGPFTVEVAQVLEASEVETDLSLLFFSPEGDFLGAIDDDNPLTGQPLELGFLGLSGDLQVAVGRSTTGRAQVSRMQLQLLGDAQLREHVDPLASAMSPHAFARGATGVAAYDAFRPFLPEYFTSPGGRIPVRWDSQGRPLRRVELRQAPRIASTDGGNNTFFGADTPRDEDDQPNFFGTSASAPHAAAIAALVLDAEGGGRSLSPRRLQQRLERSTFAHDLDPFRSRGSRGGVTLSAEGAQGLENGVAPPLSMVDAEFFTLRNDGNVPVRSVTLYGQTASPTALGSGIVFDPRPLDGEAPYRDEGFPFTVGSTGGRLDPRSVTVSYARGLGTGQFREMTLRFERGGLKRGQVLRFGIDRDLVVSGLGSSSEGNGADELGGAVLYPRDVRLPSGLGFEAERVNGRASYGVLRNQLGRGWTPVDGWGLVDALAAVG